MEPFNAIEEDSSSSSIKRIKAFSSLSPSEHAAIHSKANSSAIFLKAMQPPTVKFLLVKREYQYARVPLQVIVLALALGQVLDRTVLESERVEPVERLRREQE